MAAFTPPHRTFERIRGSLDDLITVRHTLAATRECARELVRNARALSERLHVSANADGTAPGEEDVLASRQSPFASR